MDASRVEVKDKRMKHYIKCKGRWSIHGKIECEDKFEHIGEYGDPILFAHQEKEKALDCKQNWWTGFENDKKFDQMTYSKADNDNGKNQKS
jgi:hypothetical protein